MQEVISTLSYYRAGEGWVVTNSYYTKQAMELAERSGIRLIDMLELIAEIIKLKEGSNVS